MKKKKRATPGAQPVDASDASPEVAATEASANRGASSTVKTTPSGPKKLGGSKTTKAQRQAARLAALEAAGESADGGKRKGSLSEAAKQRLERQRAAYDASREVDEEAEAEEAAVKRPKREELPWGPPVGVKTMVNDEWQTCKSSWEALVPILGPLYMDKCVWQPFYYDGICCRHLEELGFDSVVHVRADFFKKSGRPSFHAESRCHLGQSAVHGSSHEGRGFACFGEVREAVLRLDADFDSPRAVSSRCP